MSQQLNIGQIRSKLITSFTTLLGRQLVLNAFGFIAMNLFLAAILPVETIGVFFVATSIITFFSYFSDIGLAASLIQKKEGITSDDIKTSFTVQQVLVGILSVLIIVAAPNLAAFYQLSGSNYSSVWLIRTLGIVFFLSSLKILPSVILERELKFKLLAYIDIVEAVIYYGFLIVLAVLGFDLWSFSIAAFFRTISGVFLIYWFAPVKVSFGFKKETAKQLLSFGVPFQINNLLALMKDRLTPLLVAKMIGATSVGYVTWAQSWAFLPLMFMSIVIRVTFPAFSRIQDDKKAVGELIEKILLMNGILIFPAIFGMAALFPAAISHIFSQKWQPAEITFYLFCFSTFWAVLSTPLTNVLSATGHIKTTLKLMIFWTILTWVLTPILVYRYGYIGVGLTSFLISFTSIITIILTKKYFKFSLVNSLWLPLICSILMGLLIFGFANFFVVDKFTLLIAVLTGIVSYAVLVGLLGGKKITREVWEFRNG